MNLLEETKRILRNHKLSLEDVDWIGTHKGRISK